MSEPQHHNTTYSATEAAVAAEPSSATVTTGVASADVPAVTEPKTDSEVPQTTTEAATEQAKVDAATAPGASAEDAKAEVAAEKAVEPITEGQLSYKGPGLVKSLIPSKKEFWLNDEAISPQKLDLYLRGEKPEVSHAVVAWASQTGKGLLFFNKKGETDRTRPADVLALYDATDLQKQSPHEITFKLNGHNHTLKAASDVERDGWYLSIEKAIELGKASKEEIRESEGYKAEMEKLNKPNVVGSATTRSLSKPKKSTEVPAAERTGSSDGETSEDKKKSQKSRSTSRGLLNRLKGTKDEAEQKVAGKKEEKEEKKAEKEEESKAGTETPVLASTEAAPVLAGASATETPAAADVAAEEKAAETPVAESKPSKRGSIFGRVSSTFGTLRSPAKEKDLKDAELKVEPAKDGAVSDTPPVLPETARSTDSAADTAIPALQEPAAEPKAEEKEVPAVSPSKEKNSLFTGIGGYLKRGRSVSPSTLKKDQTKKDETVEEPATIEPVAKVEEPATEGGATAAEPSSETPVEKVEEPKTETTTTPNKRQSVLGSLGRRASKAINRFQAPKKENVAPAATEAKKEEVADVKPVETTPAVNGETKKEEAEPQQIGDVVPEAVHTGQPQQQQTPAAVTASA